MHHGISHGAFVFFYQDTAGNRCFLLSYLVPPHLPADYFPPRIRARGTFHTVLESELVINRLRLSGRACGTFCRLYLHYSFFINYCRIYVDILEKYIDKRESFSHNDHHSIG